MILLFAVYACLAATIVVVADTGGLAPFISWIDAVPMRDKGVHFVLAGGLSLLANVVMVRRWPFRPGAAVAVATVAVMLLTTVEELSNLLTPFRSCSADDLAANYLGAFCLGAVPVGLSTMFWSPRTA